MPLQPNSSNPSKTFTNDKLMRKDSMEIGVLIPKENQIINNRHTKKKPNSNQIFAVIFVPKINLIKVGAIKVSLNCRYMI